MDLEELIDREEIRELRGRYSHHFDGGNLDALVDLFSPQAVCEFPVSFGGPWTGRQQIRANYARYCDNGGAPFSFMHTCANQWIVMTGPSSAQARWYMLALEFKKGEGVPPLSLVGVYDDEYRKENGKWKIYRTRVDFLWPTRDLKGGVPGARVAYDGG